MRRLVLAVLLSGMSLTALAGPASACLWDNEVVGHEKQFKSSYVDQPTATSPSPTSAAQQVSATVGIAGGLGLAMLAGAMCLGVIRHRESSRKPTGGNTP